jgi:sulfur transfer complex TusBCD TusB component (DsrH family)
MAKVKLDYKAIYDICKLAEVEPIWVFVLEEDEQKRGYTEVKKDGIGYTTVARGVIVKLHEEWIKEWL